jgi:hypothetical protein
MLQILRLVYNDQIPTQTVIFTDQKPSKPEEVSVDMAQIQADHPKTQVGDAQHQVKGKDKENNGEEDEVDAIIVDLKNQLHTERIEHIARVEVLNKANHERNMALIKANHERNMAQINIQVGDAQIQIRKICTVQG